MRKDQLLKSLKNISSFFKKDDPSIEAFKAFLATKEMKARQSQDDISFAEFAEYLEKNNPKLWETILSQQDPTSEEKGVRFFREWIASDKKAKVEKLPSSSFPLEKIPQDVSADVAQNLSAKDLANVSQASKTTHRMFKKSRDAAKLLHFVKESDYAAVLNMVKEDPSLMFQYVSYQHADGTYEPISPLKLAVKLLDTYMWKIFEDQVKGTPRHERFLKQVHAQKDHVDLKPLFEAYKTYEEKFNLWRQDQLSSDNVLELDKAWLRVGLMQRDVLPRHMLKTLLSSDSWSEKSKFDVDVEPRPTNAKAYNFETHAMESVLPLHRDSGLKGGLIRGADADGGMVFFNVPTLFASALRFDAATFRHLCEVRTNDLNWLPQPAPDPVHTQAVKR